jgi:drug/metabolite transporter (DMT)-like permease
MATCEWLAFGCGQGVGRMSGRYRSLIELNLAVLLWGGTALFAKLIALPAYQITGLRSISAAAVLLAVLWARRIPLRLDTWSDWGFMAVLGITMSAHWVTYFQAIQVSTVAVGILALHTYPVMTALVEPLVFRERLRMVDVWLGLVVLVGVAILVPEFSLASGTARGVLWGILSAMFFTIRNLLSRALIRRYSGLRQMFYQVVVCALVLAPWIATRGEPLSALAVWQLVLLGVVFTAVPHTLFTNSLKHLSTKTVSVIATLLPIYGALTAAIILGERPAARTYAGGAVILAAVFFETWQVIRSPREAASRSSREGPTPRGR